jgi:hypothetical protein
MQLSRHLYAICGLGIILTAITLGSNKAILRTPAQNVLVTNSAVPVVLSPLASVQVSNKKADGPLNVRDVDTYARIPVEGYGSGTIEEPTTGTFVLLYTVPVGKRLIVQSLVFRADTPVGQEIAGGAVNCVNASGATDLLAPFKIDVQPLNAAGTPFFFGTAQTPIFVGSGGTLQVFVNRNGHDGNAGFFASFAGYLEDVPPGQ